MNKYNLKEGQVLWDYNENEHVVKKIGKRYFYLGSDPREKYKFSLENLWYRNDNYSQFDKRLYLTLQEVKNEKRHKQLFQVLRKQFDSYNHNNFTLEQLEQIIRILNLESNEKD